MIHVMLADNILHSDEYMSNLEIPLKAEVMMDVRIS